MKSNECSPVASCALRITLSASSQERLRMRILTSNTIAVLVGLIVVSLSGILAGPAQAQVSGYSIYSTDCTTSVNVDYYTGEGSGQKNSYGDEDVAINIWSPYGSYLDTNILYGTGSDVTLTNSQEPENFLAEYAANGDGGAAGFDESTWVCVPYNDTYSGINASNSLVLQGPDPGGSVNTYYKDVTISYTVSAEINELVPDDGSTADACTYISLSSGGEELTSSSNSESLANDGTDPGPYDNVVSNTVTQTYYSVEFDRVPGTSIFLSSSSIVYDTFTYGHASSFSPSTGTSALLTSGTALAYVTPTISDVE